MKAPLILALDTATDSCSVAVWRGEVLASRDARAANGHSRLLLPMVEEVLRDAGLALAGVEAVAVDNGPGSFTGVRIGVAAAHGLVLGCGARLVTVSSLAALAHAAAAEWTLPALDARMGEVFWACYRRENGAVELLGAEAVDKPVALQSLDGDARPWVGAGSGWDVHHAALSAAAGREIPWRPVRRPQAADIAALAARKLAQGGELASPPAYLRGSGEK